LGVTGFDSVPKHHMQAVLREGPRKHPIDV